MRDALRPHYLFALAVLLFALIAPAFVKGQSSVATTTVRITICGDGLATGFEVCDDGAGNNTGEYSTSTAGRKCDSTCMGYGPYCGDAILQPTRNEECDDGNNTSNDRCSAVCRIENLPSGGGGGSPGNIPGGSFTPPRETRVIIQGKAYPNANVHVLKDGETIGVVAADPKADFYFTTTNVSPGVSTFGFWAEDSKSLKSVALTTTLTIISGAATTISGAFIPPTISLDKRAVAQGQEVVVSGQTAPSVTVATHVNSEHEIIEKVVSDARGNWSLAFDTAPLENEAFHTAKALFETTVGSNVVKSSFSQSLSFYVGRRQVGAGLFADLNGDGKVNLVDFSILLFYWNTAGPVGDLNTDRRVNLTDFSILLFNWTG